MGYMMSSVNHSVEDIDRHASKQRTSQINPNRSTTNILKLNHPRPSRIPYGKNFAPITPPSSNSPTPILDPRDYFSFKPALNAESSISLDAYAIPEEADVGHHVSASPTVYSLASVTSWLRSLAPDINWEVVVLCGVWYTFSIISSNSTKAILSQFSYPITLTQFQFSLNAFFCTSFFASLSAVPNLSLRFSPGSVPKLQEINSLRKFLTPTATIISTTVPMGLFQFVGHITSHKATSVIPVSLVHTVKALSPIATILIYRLVHKVSVRPITYVTLIPLMLGIMLTCYKPKKALSSRDDGYMTGLMYAFISMFIFVSQNVFAKKRLTYNSSSGTSRESLPTHKATEEKKLDKLTILLFCSILGFLFTTPFYIISEFRNEVISLTDISRPLLLLVLINGFSHFMQSLMAFSLLGTISTVNYSVASIMKRIIVIMFAFFWETSFSFTSLQSYGIILTGFGLYAYDKWGMEKRKAVSDYTDMHSDQAFTFRITLGILIRTTLCILFRSFSCIHICL